MMTFIMSRYDLHAHSTWVRQVHRAPTLADRWALGGVNLQVMKSGTVLR